MTARKKSEARPDPGPGRRGRTLAVLCLLGAISALWALFLWTELVRARSGGTPFCGFGDDGDCGVLWDAAFASAVHELTGVPVAGWGLVWGIVAFLLPLAALAREADGKGVEVLWPAVLVTGGAGVAGVVVLLAASAVTGLFCISCAPTYVLSAAYAVLAGAGRQRSATQRSWSGAGVAAALLAGVYLLLLHPGLRTPASVAREGRQALSAAAGVAADAASTAPAARLTIPDADRQLAELIASLSPQARQVLADSLAIYASSAQVEPREPRALVGSPTAPVRITDFTDVGCTHCATLHGTLSYLRALLPAASFSVDSRQFPLDGNCNHRLPIRGPESIRCLGARAQICFEDSEHRSELSKALFAAQRELTPDRVFALAAPLVTRDELERCLASPETARKLAADVEYAWLFEPDGTPLVLVNGRRGTSFGPFLYAMVLTGGAASHPSFAELPPPNPQAHLH